MTNSLKRSLWAAGILVGLAALVWYFSRTEAIAVTLATVERGDVEATVANTRAGTVDACQRARMSPATAGQIAKLPVSEGDRVRAGDVLLELWNEDLTAEVKLAEEDVAASQARIEEACTRAEVAEREAERFLRMSEEGIVSEDATDKAVGDAKASRAACDASQAAAEVARARVEVAGAALERTRLRAPFDGIVAEVNGELGEFVTPSPVGVPTPPTVDLIKSGCVYVTAPIDEVDAGGIKVGMDARITLDAFSDRVFAGRVRRIAPYVLDLEKQARTVDVEVEFLDPGESDTLLAGYSADVEIILAVRRDVARLPTEALLDGNKVLLYTDPRSELEEIEVETGVANWQFTEIVSTLAEGDRVVLSVDREGVGAGVRVTIEEE